MLRAPVMQPACQGIQAKLDMVGACKPLGFFDPLGFSKDASPASMAKYAPRPDERTLCGSSGRLKAALSHCADVHAQWGGGGGGGAG